MRIKVQDQVTLNNKFGLLWSGWMGGQWAFTLDLLPHFGNRSLVVLCSGPGDLAINSVAHGLVPEAVCVDSMMTPLAYGQGIVGGSPYWNKSIIDTIKKVNAEHTPVVPPELAKPANLFQKIKVFDSKSITFEQDDALRYVKENQFKPGTNIYLATPTNLSEPGLLTFYSMYQGAFEDPSLDGSFDNWVNPDLERTYISYIFEVLKEHGTHYNVFFGVGSGGVTIDEYRDFLSSFGAVSTILYKPFITSTGYTFEDWVLRVSINSKLS